MLQLKQVQVLGTRNPFDDIITIEAADLVSLRATNVSFGEDDASSSGSGSGSNSNGNGAGNVGRNGRVGTQSGKNQFRTDSQISGRSLKERELERWQPTDGVCPMTMTMTCVIYQLLDVTRFVK